MKRRFVLLVTLLLVALILPGCAGYYGGYGYDGNRYPYGHGYYRYDYGYPHGYYHHHNRDWDDHRR